MKAIGAAALLAISVLAGQAQAGEVFGGVYGHSLGPPGREQGTVDVVGGYRTDRIGGILSYIGSPHVHIMAGVNSFFPTDFVAVGFDYRLPIAHSRFYVRPGLGLAYTTGKAGLPPSNVPGLSPAEQASRKYIADRRIDFGSNVLFEPELAFGYTLSPKLSAELSYFHLSNGEIFHQGKNQGMDDIGLRLNYRFGGR